MKKRRSQLFYLIVFIFAQLALFSLLGLWIFRYVFNHLNITQIEKDIASRVTTEGIDVIILICGCGLFAAIYLGMILIFRNLNIQLKIAKLYDNFIGNITHELKSPLASIQLYLDTMDNRDIPRSKQKEFIAMMRRDTNRLTGLVNSVLEITGLEQKRMLFECQVYNADSALRTVIDEARQQLKLPVDTVTIRGEVSLQFVADLNALKTVFRNLFDNAIKYSIDPVQIIINLKRNTKMIVIEFCDNGIGIPFPEQKKVFDKFHRIYNSNIPNVKGTGLGLYLVKEIVRHHGGKIELFSDGEYKGTTFRIKLPIFNVTRKRYLSSLLKITRLMRQRQEVNRG
ncbi:HAMP domain-containing histidine kinase [bacterium]|nr:HAMP domain-containing histidine kinase [bacterium]